ncbi:hypothetical protein HMPREF1155_1794 [Slackia sp. CM382]|nr:hypothetical protein HMPREF1155_1794 [Slackia sp. CM382]
MISRHVQGCGRSAGRRIPARPVPAYAGTGAREKETGAFSLSESYAVRLRTGICSL